MADLFDDLKIDLVGQGGPKKPSPDLFDDLSINLKPKQNTSLLSDLSTDAKRGFQQLPGMVTGLGDIVSAALTGERHVSKAADKLGEMTGFQPGKWAEEARAEYSPQRQAADAEIDKAWEEGSATDVASAYLSNPGKVLGLVAESAPSMLAGGLAGRAALGAGRVAGAITAPTTAAQAVRQAVIAGAGGEGAVIAGQAMDQISDDVDARTAAAAAAGAGIVGVGLGYAGGRVAHGLGLADPETVFAGGVTGAVANRPQAGRLVRRMLGGAMSEGAFEELPQSVQEQMWQNWAEGKPLMEGTARAAVEGTLAGGMMGAGANVLPSSRGAQPVPQSEQDVAGEASAEGFARQAANEAAVLRGEALADEEAGMPNVLQTLPPDGRAALQAQRDAARQAREAETARNRAEQPSPDDEIFQSTGRAPLMSEQMGLDPAAGPMSAAAALAVDRGVSPAASPLQDVAQTQAHQAEHLRVDPSTGEILQGVPTDPVASLQARLEFVERQSRINGWDKPLIEERDRVTAELAALSPAGAEPSQMAADSIPAPAPEIASESVTSAASWAAMTAEERASIATEAGLTPAMASRVPAAEWGKINPRARTKIEQVMQPQVVDGGAREQSSSAATRVAAATEQDGSTFDVSGRTDAQLNHLATNGQPGWKEAAQTELSRRSQTADSSDVAGSQINRAWTSFAPESGTLGVPRARMPQIKAEHRGAMVQFMAARGVGHQQETIAASNLKPTQAEFSPRKVKQAKGFSGGDRSILVSADGYVLDGHHQWLAARENNAGVRAIRLNAPIRDLVTLAHEFPSSTTAKGAVSTPAGQGASTNGAISSERPDAAMASPGAAQARADVAGSPGAAPQQPDVPAASGVEPAARGAVAGSRTAEPAGGSVDGGAAVAAPPNWRKNYLQARTYAKALGVQPQEGQKLAGLVMSELQEKNEALEALTAELAAEGEAANADAAVAAVETEGSPDGGVLGSAADRTDASARGTGLRRIDAAVYGMAAEGKSGSDILNFIAGASRSPFNRQLARLLMKTGIAPSVSVGDGSGWKFRADLGSKGAAAAYNPKVDSVELFRPASAERHVLHEMVHAATVRALEKKGVASGQMKALFAHVQKTGKLQGQYGMSNIDEFIAEAFSNPDFQARLKSVAVPSPASSSTVKTAWDWFVRAVRAMLRLPVESHNALSRALEIGAAVMREDRALRRAGQRAGGDGLASFDARASDAEAWALVEQYAGQDGAPAEAQIQDAVRQYRETEQAYGGRDAWQRAHDAGRTKLGYRQWVQVRTPNFKQWFGDWEALRAQEQLGAMEPVALNLPESLRGASLVDLRDAVRMHLDALADAGAVASHEALGDIGFSKSNNKKAVSTGATPEKLQAARDIAGVIESGIHAGSAVSAKPDEARHGVTYHTLATKVSAFGREFVAVVTVKQSQDGQRFYNNIAVQSGQEKAPAAYPGDRASKDVGSATAFTGASSSLLPAMRGVNPDSASKVVDPETGEPMAVYHATDNDFSVFSADRQGENTDANASSEEYAQTARLGHWFSDHDVSGATAQSVVMPVYLSIKNPKRYDSLTWLAERAIPSAGSAQELRAQLESEGRDGIVVEDEEFGGYSYIAFRPEQIKSTTGNVGTFSDGSGNIRFSRAGRDAFAPDSYDAQQFAQAVDRIAAAESALRTDLTVGDTPAVLRALGAKALPIQMPSSMIHKASRSAIRGHDVPSTVLRNLPALLADPVMVFDSRTEQGALVALVDARDESNRPVVVAVHLDAKGGGFHSINRIASIYGKDSVADIERWMRGDLRYYKTQKASGWLRAVGLQLPEANTIKRLNPRVITEADVVNARFSFAGQNAATADRHALSSAQQRIEAGEDSEIVRQETGWHRGADGKWRFEIDDSDARLKVGHKGVPVVKTLSGVPQLPGGWYALGDLLDHPALFAAYPALRDTAVKFLPGPETGTMGRINGDGNILLSDSMARTEALSVLLHEVQHGIQNVEGFATGGSAKGSAADIAQARLDFGESRRRVERITEQHMQEAQRLLVHEPDSSFVRSAIEKWQGRLGERSDENPFGVTRQEAIKFELMERDAVLQSILGKERRNATIATLEPYELYRRLAGEVEARNTQARQRMTADERRATPPSQTTDVADADVIVTFNGKEMASAPAPANARPVSRQGAAQAVQRVQAVADAIVTKWKNAPEVIAVASMQDARVPQAVRAHDEMQRSQGAEGEPEGFFYQGRVYLVASQLNGGKDVARVLFHESLGHYGLRGVFGQELGQILNQIATVRRQQVRGKARAYGLTESAADLRIAAEEVLAEMAQTTPGLGFVKRAIAAIRTWLREHVPGFERLAVSGAEIIRNYILPARAFVERGGRPVSGLESVQAAFDRSSRTAGKGSANYVIWDEAQLTPEAAQIEVMYSRAGMGSPQQFASNIGDGLKAITATNVKELGRHKLTDWLKLGLQFLGRRQIVDVYGGVLPMAEYDRLAAQMEADKNDVGATADNLARRWSKLPDEAKLADLMHDATLAQIDADSDVAYVDGDDKGKSGALKSRFRALTQEAQVVYREARDHYREHHGAVRQAIIDRIERSELRGGRRAELLKRMDDDFFKSIKGVYFPLARFGQYVVVVRDDSGKVENVSRAETMDEAEAMRQELVKAFPMKDGYQVGRVTLSKEFVASKDMVGRGFMAELYDALDKQDLPAGQLAELEDTLGQLYLSSLPDLSWAKHGIHRKGTPGFSNDARRAFAQNTFHGARYLAKLRYGDQMYVELERMQKHVDAMSAVDDFDQPAAQRVVDEMNKRHEAMMSPKSNPLSTALTSFGFVYYLGLSPAAAAVNLSQTALVAYPVMGAKWGWAKSAKALMDASKEAIVGKNDIRTQLKDADEIAAYDAAVRAGTIDVTQAHDLAGIAQGEDAKVMWKIRPVMRLASYLFHHAERFNRSVTFMAAYRLARQAGANHDAAFEQATKATYDGHFDYSAGNRPRVMQGNVARVVLLFKQFAQNMVFTLARNAYQSVKGESPAVRREARKVFAALMATHAAAAGVLGLPLVGTLLTVASALGGDDDEPWDAEAALRNMLADAFGPKASEVIAKGFSRLTPWDISGRVGLNNLILPDVQEGLEGQRWAEAFSTAMLGPVIGMGVNAAKGVQKMADGDYGRGLEDMTPIVVRNGIKALRYWNEGAQDRTGVSIKDEVGLPGVLGQVAGFSPSEVRLAFEGRSAVMDADRRLSARRSELLGQFARAAMEKDFERMAEARSAISTFNQKNPGRRITAPQMWQSVRGRQRRIDQAQDGVFLPKGRRDAMDAGGFAFQ